MAFTPEELQIIEYGRSNGKSKEETQRALEKYRASKAPVATDTPPQKSFMDKVTGGAKAVTDFLGLGSTTDVLGRAIARTDVGAKLTGTDVEANKEYIPAPNKKELAGAALQTGAVAAGLGVTGPASLLGKAAVGAGLGYAFDIGQDMAQNKPVEDIIKPGMSAAVGLIAPGAGPAAKGAGKAAANTAKAVTNSKVVKGALQTGIEFAERVPRFVSKKQVAIRDAATRAERIATAPAPIGNAIRAGVDERIINTIEQADPVTRNDYKEIVRLAEESISTTGTLKTSARPEIVAGEAAAKQYKIIAAQKQKIGKAIGDQVANLSNDALVPMAPARERLDDILSEARVVVNREADGSVSLDFSKSGFSKEQRSKINELYDLANEGGDELTPAEIHAKDRLFSQLQREARMDKIGDIRVGDTSLFQAFRDVYSDTLEEVAPEIRPLNRQYRNLSTFTEDIEKTIIGTGKYETNANMDQAEFAQTALRRLFSEAQSAADYRAIAEEMDAASRALGYDGAKPEDLARFAYEIRKIYPETTPRTGFEGASRFSVGGAVDAIMSAGKADLTDQQKALRELLASFNEAN